MQRLDACEACRELGGGKEVDLLLGEIDGRLDVHAQQDQRLHQFIDARAEDAVERASRGTQGRVR